MISRDDNIQQYVFQTITSGKINHCVCVNIICELKLKERQRQKTKYKKIKLQSRTSTHHTGASFLQKELQWSRSAFAPRQIKKIPSLPQSVVTWSARRLSIGLSHWCTMCGGNDVVCVAHLSASSLHCEFLQ